MSGIASQTAKEPGKEQSLLGSQYLLMGVFSNDFATVDFREELCYHSRPEKAKFKRHMERDRKPMKESHARRRAFRFGFPCCFGCPLRGVCLAAAARKWGPQKSASVASSFLGQSFAALVYDKLTPRCQLSFYFMPFCPVFAPFNDDFSF